MRRWQRGAVAAATVAAIAPMAVQEASAQQWRQIEIADPITDHRRVYLLLEYDRGLFLRFGCEQGTHGVYRGVSLMPGPFLARAFTLPVIHRIGDEAPIESRWIAADTSGALLAPFSLYDFLESALVVDRLVFRFTDDSYRTTTAVVPTANLSDVSNAFIEACDALD